MADEMSDGVYELVVTESLRQRLEESTDIFAELGDLDGPALDGALMALVTARAARAA